MGRSQSASFPSGRDTIFFDDIDSYVGAEANTYVVTDFEPGWNGDILDLSDAVAYSRWSGSNPFDTESGMLRWENVGGNALLYIDSDGFQGAGSERLLITLRGISSASVTSDNYTW